MGWVIESYLNALLIFANFKDKKGLHECSMTLNQSCLLIVETNKIFQNGKKRSEEYKTILNI